MPDEILNIDYNIKKMIVRRMNEKKTLSEAAESLGIALRTLYRYRWRYNIKRSESTKEYFIKEEKVF